MKKFKFNILKDIELKLISLAIATFLWVMVTGKEYRVGDFTIPVETTGLSDNLTITRISSLDNADVKNVVVRVRATEPIIRTLDEKSMYLRVNVSHIEVGMHPLQLNEDMVSGRPAGAEITDIFPRVLEMTVEERVTRPFIVVNPEILGKPAEGFEVFQVTCTPPTVSARGPRSLVENIEKVSTPPVIIDDRIAERTAIRREFDLVSPDPLVILTPRRVTLRVDIREKIITRHFQNVTVEIRGARYETRMNPRTIGVWVQGPISQMQSLTGKSLSVHIQLTGEEEQGKNLRLTPQFEAVPRESFPDVSLERFSQSYVDVYITNQRL